MDANETSLFTGKDGIIQLGSGGDSTFSRLAGPGGKLDKLALMKVPKPSAGGDTGNEGEARAFHPPSKKGGKVGFKVDIKDGQVRMAPDGQHWYTVVWTAHPSEDTGSESSDGGEDTDDAVSDGDKGTARVKSKYVKKGRAQRHTMQHPPDATDCSVATVTDDTVTLSDGWAFANLSADAPEYLTESEAEALISKLDIDGDGTIDEAEWNAYWEQFNGMFCAG